MTIVTIQQQCLLRTRENNRWSKNNFGEIHKNKPRGLYLSKALFEGLIFGGAYIRRGLSKEENLRFKIDRASLTVGSEFIVFALFYFVFEGNFSSTSSQGAYIWRGDLTEGFFRYRFGGLIFGRAYTWRGLFSEFYGIPRARMGVSLLLN